MTLWLSAGSERSRIRSPGCLIKAGFRGKLLSEAEDGEEVASRCM